MFPAVTPWIALAAALAAVVPEASPDTTEASEIGAPGDAVEEDSGANPWVIGGTSVAIVGALGAWGYGAWWNEGTQAFHFIDTGYLNQNTYAGGSDKLGHMYTSYLWVKLVTQLYEALGMSHTGAAWLSAGAVSVVANGIELADGFTSYGFEYADVIFNMLGIGLGLASDLSPSVSSIVGMRVGYVPSRDFLANEKTFIKFINDYTGMLFYLDFKGKGIMEALDRDPGVARYLMGGLVWGTDHYSPVRRHEERRRSFGMYVGLSLPEILRANYPDDAGVEGYATFFDYYAMPFLSLAVLSDLNTGEWYLNFGVSNRLEIGF